MKTHRKKKRRKQENETIKSEKEKDLKNENKKEIDIFAEDSENETTDSKYITDVTDIKIKKTIDNKDSDNDSGSLATDESEWQTTSEMEDGELSETDEEMLQDVPTEGKLNITEDTEVTTRKSFPILQNICMKTCRHVYQTCEKGLNSV